MPRTVGIGSLEKVKLFESFPKYAETQDSNVFLIGEFDGSLMVCAVKAEQFSVDVVQDGDLLLPEYLFRIRCLGRSDVKGIPEGMKIVESLGYQLW